MITIDIRKSNKCNEEYSAFVSFPYDNTIVNTIRSLSTRYWNNDSKEWEIPTKKIEVLVSKLQDFDITIKGHYLEDEKEVEIDKLVPSNFEFKTKPFEHQVEGFEYGLKYDRWLLGDEQGLGKTKQVIDIAVAKKLANGYKHCLIICGVNGLKWNWYNEVHTHSNEGARILGQKERKNGNIVVGSSKDKLNDLKNINAINEYFLITNVETLRDSDIVDELKKLCKDNTIGMIALDEAHKCFDYNTPILTNLGIIKIGDIVSRKIPCNVLSYNEHTGLNEWKTVVDWHENLIMDRLLELTIETEHGVKTIKCTKDHKFYTTNRGWVEAQYLTEDDDIEEF